MTAPPGEARRLARPPSPRRAPEDLPVEPAPVSVAALVTLLGLTAGGRAAAAYEFDLTCSGDPAAPGAVTARGRGAYRSEPEVAMRVVFDSVAFDGVAVPGGMEERVEGGATYVRPAPEAGWTRVEPDGALGAEVERMLARARGAEPRAPLAAVLAAGGFADLGEEELAGCRAVHHAGRLDGWAAGGAAVDVRVDVWVGPDGAARRLVALAPTPAGEMRIAMDFAGSF